MGKTIIVTGGAGFIGSNFVFHMLKKYPDYRIICLDKLTYAGNLSTLAPVMENPNFRFVKADICDREAVYQLFEEEHPDIVVNFAAESHVDRSIENPEVFLQTNILGTQVLMDACRKYGIERYFMMFPSLFLNFSPVLPTVGSFGRCARKRRIKQGSRLPGSFVNPGSRGGRGCRPARPDSSPGGSVYLENRSNASPCRRPRSLMVSPSTPRRSVMTSRIKAPARITSARLGCSPGSSLRCSKVRVR